MKTITVILQLMTMFALAGLQGCTKTKLFVINSLADDGNFTLFSDIPYGPDQRQRLDVYLPLAKTGTPSAESGQKPTVLFIPGGCWGACDTFPKEDYRFVAESLVLQGYPTVVINYRLYPDFLYPEILADMTSAVTWVLNDIAETGHPIPTHRDLVLMGHSAGAHLAAMVALNEQLLTTEERQHILGFIGLAGPYDFLPFTEPYQPILFGPEARFPESQPINFVEGTEAPMLLLYGKDDTSVKPRNIVNLANKVRDTGGRVKALCYDDIDHGEIVGALSVVLREKLPVYTDILSFLHAIEHRHGQPDAMREESISNCEF